MSDPISRNDPSQNRPSQMPNAEGAIDSSQFDAETKKLVKKVQQSGGYGDWLGVGKNRATAELTQKLKSDGYSDPVIEKFAASLREGK